MEGNRFFPSSHHDDLARHADSLFQRPSSVTFVRLGPSVEALLDPFAPDIAAAWALRVAPQSFNFLGNTVTLWLPLYPPV